MDFIKWFISVYSIMSLLIWWWILLPDVLRFHRCATREHTSLDFPIPENTLYHHVLLKVFIAEFCLLLLVKDMCICVDKCFSFFLFLLSGLILPLKNELVGYFYFPKVLKKVVYFKIIFLSLEL